MLRSGFVFLFFWNIFSVAMAENVTHTFANKTLRADFPERYRIIEDSPQRLLLASGKSNEETLELIIQEMGDVASVRRFLENEASKKHVQIYETKNILEVSDSKSVLFWNVRPMRSGNTVLGFGTKVILITKIGPAPENGSATDEFEFLFKDTTEILTSMENENVATMSSPIEEMPRPDVVKILNNDEACAISKQDRINEQEWFLIKGFYLTHMHGAMIEVSECIITPLLSDRVRARFTSYGDEFRRKCGGILMSAARGNFIGTFEKRRRQFAEKSFTVNIFIIRDIESEDLSLENISCKLKN